MKATKIDWCDATINPVIGCKNACQYCYAKRLNARFGWVQAFDEPRYFPERLKEFYAKPPKAIFCDSMSDVAYWNDEAVSGMGKAMDDNPQHNYIFLTKGANCYRDKTATCEYRFFVGAPNVYHGLSVTTQNDLKKLCEAFDFLSIEPMLEFMRLPNTSSKLRQIIIGAETGNRIGKVVPQKEWVTRLAAQADVLGIRVFMKESLRNIMGDKFRQDPLIWAIGGKNVNN